MFYSIPPKLDTSFIKNSGKNFLRPLSAPCPHRIFIINFYKKTYKVWRYCKAILYLHNILKRLKKCSRITGQKPKTTKFDHHRWSSQKEYELRYWLERKGVGEGEQKCLLEIWTNYRYNWVSKSATHRPWSTSLP